MWNSSKVFDLHLPRQRRLIAARPPFFLSLAFSLGIWAANVVSVPFLSAALITLLILFLLTCFRRTLFFVPVSLALFFGIGILFGTNDRTVPEHHVALTAPEGALLLEGAVTTVPETVVKGKKETVSFVLEAYDFFRNGSRCQTQGKVQVFLHNPSRPIRFGDRLRLRGRLELPKESRNPNSFDYASYLADQGITRMFRGIGRFSVVRQRAGEGNRLFLLANRIRVGLKSRLEQLLPSPHRELASALILGFRKNIPREIQDAFIKTGTAHLLAISGLNVSLIGGSFYLLLSFLRFRRTPNLVLTIAFISAYAILAGGNMPVARAAIMGIVILLSFLLGEERNIKSALFFAYFILLVWKPSALFQASFQLSFSAMAALIFLLPKFERAFRQAASESEDETQMPNPAAKPTNFSWIGKGIRYLRETSLQTFFASLAATVGMFPILIWYFNLFSVIGFLANILAIPICTVGIAVTLLVLLVDAAVPPIGPYLAVLPEFLFGFELWLVEKFSKIPFGYFYFPRPSWPFLVLYYGFLAAWILFFDRLRSKWFRALSFLPVALMIIVLLVGVSVRRSRIIFFDLGKTEGAFVSFTNGANCLINTGRGVPNDQAYWILRPFLMGSGIGKLDSLVLTRVDGRHAGGFQTLARHFRLQKAWIPSASFEDPHLKKFLGFPFPLAHRVIPLGQGDRIQFGSDASIYVAPLEISQARIGALQIVDRDRRALYVTSLDRRTFEILTKLNEFEYDMVFLPHHEFAISEVERTFLRRLSTRFLILNQRDGIAEFRRELEALGPWAFLFLEETGALEFYRSQGRWIYRTSVNQFSRSNMSAKVYLPR